MKCIHLIPTYVALLGALIFANYCANSQTVKGWEVVPPSPDAAALGKYGNTPVGMFSGILSLFVSKHCSIERSICNIVQCLRSYRYY
jgi:hypothetical protein